MHVYIDIYKFYMCTCIYVYIYIYIYMHVYYIYIHLIKASFKPLHRVEHFIPIFGFFCNERL